MTLNDSGPYVLSCTGPQGAGAETLNLRVYPFAPNDTCANATVRNPPFSVVQQDFFATVEGDEVFPSCALDGASVWYEVVPTQSGTLALSTIGSNYDTVISVFDGDGFDRCDTAVELACNDDAFALQSRVVLNVTEAARWISIAVPGARVALVRMNRPCRSTSRTIPL